eukprot:5433890-Prymnesium_polylepis.1
MRRVREIDELDRGNVLQREDDAWLEALALLALGVGDGPALVVHQEEPPPPLVRLLLVALHQPALQVVRERDLRELRVAHLVRGLTVGTAAAALGGAALVRAALLRAAAPLGAARLAAGRARPVARRRRALRAVVLGREWARLAALIARGGRLVALLALLLALLGLRAVAPAEGGGPHDLHRGAGRRHDPRAGARLLFRLGVGGLVGRLLRRRRLGLRAAPPGEGERAADRHHCCLHGSCVCAFGALGFRRAWARAELFVTVADVEVGLIWK